MKDTSDPVHVTSLCGNVDLSPREPERSALVSTCRLDLQQSLLSIRLKGSHVVAVSIAIQIGNPTNVGGKVVTPSPSQAVAFKLHDEFLAGFS